MGDASRTRAALHCVCCALQRAGIRYVDAECLRLAKHAGSSVDSIMWALVADLLEFMQGSVCDSCTQRPCESARELSALEKEAVAFRLMLLGYPRADYLEDSRELLLAFGYLLSASQLLKMARITNNRHPWPPYPDDIACWDRLPATSGRQPPSDSDGLSHHILQLHSRWHAEVRRLEQLESHRIWLLKQIRDLGSRTLLSLQVSDKTKKLLPPTLYELFVLERNLLQEHMEDLQHSISSMQTSKAASQRKHAV